jgi:hypothetical protein
MEVLAFVHTHPNSVAVNEPTSKKDYQFAYLGIHNYIISHHYFYDAFYDTYGNEVFDRHNVNHNLPAIMQNTRIAVDVTSPDHGQLREKSIYFSLIKQ